MYVVDRKGDFLHLLKVRKFQLKLNEECRFLGCVTMWFL
jgi:hypothetical protein